MSEAELHVLRSRLRGGILNKARRGELEIRLPIGFVYDGEGRVSLDPDQRIQESIREFFLTFRRTASAMATVKAFRRAGLKFPRRIYRGPHKGDVQWDELDHSRALWILHHPRYTGAFCFGRTRTRKLPDGHQVSQTLPVDEWTALIRDAHQGYITWEQFEQHVQILHDNAQAHGCERDLGAPREGPALLQGLAICGRCGERMTIRYHVHDTQRVPDYMCQRRSINEGVGRPCQQINGAELDQAIGRLLVETVTPVTLQVALAVQKELEDRSGEFDRLRRQEIERASYEVDLARRRYMRVDPDNRLVADSLEAEWNLALRALAAAQERYEKQCETRSAQLNKKQRESIMALAQDFPRLWNDPQTPEREKKRMARLLIADVTLLKDTEIIARVRFKGGATRELRLSLPKPSWQLRQTPTAVVAEIDRLLEGHTDHETAELLNASGMRSGEGLPFRRLMVRRIRIDYGLKTQYERLRARGLLSATEIAKYLKVCTATIADWRRAGLLKAYQYNDNGQYLYERPGVDAPRRFAHKNKARREAAVDVTTPWHD